MTLVFLHPHKRVSYREERTGDLRLFGTFVEIEVDDGTIRPLDAGTRPISTSLEDKQKSSHSTPFIID